MNHPDAAKAHFDANGRDEARSLSEVVRSRRQSYRDSLSRLTKLTGDRWSVVVRPSNGLNWRVFRYLDARLPLQGWKIHVSSSVVEASELSEQVIPLLLRLCVSFKIPDDLDGVFAINRGDAGATQLGKVLTIYLSADERASLIVKQVCAAWTSASGPRVVSDLEISRQSRVYLRFGSFGGEPLVDSRGFYNLALKHPDGGLFADERSTCGLQFEWAPAPPVNAHQYVDDVLENVEIEGMSYCPLMLVRQGPKGKVQVALNVDAGSMATLKVANQGVGGDYLGLDACDRLCNEHRILRLVQDARIAPKSHGIVVGTASSVLAMEDLEGPTLDELSPQEAVKALPLLARSIALLHDRGVAHNDIKLANAILVDGQVRLIDFELAGPIGSQKIHFGGTNNHYLASADDAKISSATDIYSLGACLAHAVQGADPSAVLAGSGRLVGALCALEFREAASVVALLMRPLAHQQIKASQVESILSERSNLFLSRKTKHYSLKQKRKLMNWARRATIAAAQSTRRFRRTPNVDHNCFNWTNQHLNFEFTCEGINIGASGIILGLMSIDTALGRQDFRHDIIGGADWLAARPPIGSCAGLFSGDAGVALALAVASRRYGKVHWARRARARLESAMADCTEPDLFNGSAGIVVAACLIARALNEEWPKLLVSSAVPKLLDSSETVNDVIAWPADEQCTGAGHGSAGIALALAMWGKQAACARSSAMAFDVFANLYAHAQTANGEGLLSSLSPDPVAVPQGNWCHGTGGYLWCLLSAFGDDPRLRNPIDWAVGVFDSLTAIQNPTYCHGISGQLELWRMLNGIPRFSSLAARKITSIVNVIRAYHLNQNGEKLWCSETPNIVTPDLWVGFLGPASALALYSCASTEALLSSGWLERCATSSNLRQNRGRERIFNES